jgi:DNA-binding HxlR family transcriptional regulator
MSGTREGILVKSASGRATPAKKQRALADYSPKHDPLRDNCPVKAAIDVIRGRWKPHILRELHEGGPKRFTELRTALPQVTAQALSTQLRQLELDEIVTRTVFPEVPARVEYQLSEFGQTLSCVMAELDAWGTKYLARRRRNGSASGSRT